MQQNGVSLIRRACPKNCLSCANSFSEPAQETQENGSDILHCMERGGEIVQEDGYCADYN